VIRAISFKEDDMTTRLRPAPSRREWHEQPLARLGTLLTIALVISALGGWTRKARAADQASMPVQTEFVGTITALESDLAKVQGELAVAKVQLDRHQTIDRYSAKYRIPSDLAGAINDISIAEGIDPALAFRLVQIESRFERTARSSANAMGYTQVRLPTARFYDPSVTEKSLQERDTNLRIGFRFLRDLLNQFDGNEHLALLAYNRGPQRVLDILAAGGDPANGYSDAVLRGLKRPLR